MVKESSPPKIAVAMLAYNEGKYIGSISIGLGLVAGLTVIHTYYASYVLATGTKLISILLITMGILCVFTGIILNVLVERINDSL